MPMHPPVLVLTSFQRRRQVHKKKTHRRFLLTMLTRFHRRRQPVFKFLLASAKTSGDDKGNKKGPMPQKTKKQHLPILALTPFLQKKKKLHNKKHRSRRYRIPVLIPFLQERQVYKQRRTRRRQVLVLIPFLLRRQGFKFLPASVKILEDDKDNKNVLSLTMS